VLIERSKAESRRRVTELDQARKRAEKATRQALARRIAAVAESSVSMGDVLEVPLALASESLRMEPTIEGDMALRHAMRRAPIQHSGVNNEGPVTAGGVQPGRHPRRHRQQ
jgi:hypothetical protein